MSTGFENHLAQVLSGAAQAGAEPPAGSVAPRVIARADRIRRRRSMVVAAVAATVLALGGGTAWWIQPGADAVRQLPATGPTTAGPIESPDASLPPVEEGDHTMSAAEKAAAVRAEAAFLRWADGLPRATAEDYPRLGGSPGAPTLSYRGHTAALPARWRRWSHGRSPRSA